jgi:molybdate transport system substrate-binding protein
VTRPVATVGVALLVVAGCGTGTGERGGARSGTVTVLAAASLTEAFEQIGDDFEVERPDIDVEFSFAASSELAVQIQQGAPADVFASADKSTMKQVVDADDVAVEPRIFTRNRLAIAVEGGNPRRIRGLDDLDEPGLVVVLCAQQVPCGKLADKVLADAGVSITPASRAKSVKATLTLVELGEADAAIVYVTDVEASGEVDGVEIPDDQNVVAPYPIALLTESPNPDAARDFVQFVTSPDGQRTLRRFGFLPA